MQDNMSSTLDIEVIKVTHCEQCKRAFKKNEPKYGNLGEPQQYCFKCFCNEGNV